MTNMSFNHWRVRSLEHNAAVSSALTWDAKLDLGEFKKSYFGRLFGKENVTKAEKAHRLLEEATLYAKSNTYNAGFAGDWVFRGSARTRPVITGRGWPLPAELRTGGGGLRGSGRVVERAGREAGPLPEGPCEISAVHVDAVCHLQNAKLPLVGYKAWPLGNDNASAPPPAQLTRLLREAETALALEERYMRKYSRWVKGCDEQGQLCGHEQGVIQPLKQLVKALTERLEIREKTPRMAQGAVARPGEN